MGHKKHLLIKKHLLTQCVRRVLVGAALSAVLPAAAVPLPYRGVVVNPDGAPACHGRATLPCACHGRVTTENGTPAANAVVVLFRQTNGAGESIDNTTTSADGTFRFKPNSAGASFSVEVKKAGYGNTVSVETRAAPGGDVAFAIRLERADSFLAGTVADRYGRPIAGADVEAADVDNLHVLTDAKGQFRLVGVPEGVRHIRVTASGGHRASYSIQSGQNGALVYALSDADMAASDAQMKAAQAADVNLHGNGKDAAALLRDAEERAAMTGKKVFLVFGASWCGGCYRLGCFLERPKVKAIMGARYVVLELDILEDNGMGWENPGGVGLYKKYGGDGTVPFWVFLDPTGRAVVDSIVDGQNAGLGGGLKVDEHFLSLVKAGAPGVSASELSTLRRLLRHINDD